MVRPVGDAHRRELAVVLNRFTELHRLVDR